MSRVRVEPLTRDVVDGVLVPAAGPGTAPAAPMRTDLALVAYFEDERPLRGLAAFLDWRTGGKLSALLRSGWCTGRAGEAVLLPGTRGLPSDRIVLLGLGLLRDFDAATARTAASTAVELVAKLLPRDVLFAMPGLAEDREIVESVFAGIVLALGGTPRIPNDDDDDESVHARADDPAQRRANAPGAPARQAVGGPVLAEVGGPVLAELVGAVEPELGGPAVPEVGGPAIGVGDARTPHRWWVIAEPRHVGRLRRVLEGPPRAAHG